MWPDSSMDHLETNRRGLEAAASAPEQATHEQACFAIRQLLLAKLDEYNHICFANFVNPLVLQSAGPTATGAPAIQCALLRNDDDFHGTIRLAQSDDGASGREKLEVISGGPWIDFDVWLNGVASADCRTYTGRQGYDLLSSWWEANGKVFRLSSLPRQLLNDIILRAIGSRVRLGQDSLGITRPRRPAFQSFIDLMGHECEWYGEHVYREEYEMYVPPIDTGLFYVNKDIAMLARKVLLVDTTKFIHHPYQFHDLLQLVRPHTLEHALRRLQVSFTVNDYMTFFSVRLACPPYDRPSIYLAPKSGRVPGAAALRHLAGLRHLELHFPAHLYEHESNPWSESHCLANGERLPALQWKRFPCQKRLLELILAYAYDFVIHIPHIELRGYIKDCVKRKWEAILRDRDNGHHLITIKDFQDYVETIPVTALPPRCACPKRCSYVDVNYVDRQITDHPENNDPYLRHKCIEVAVNQWSFDFDDTMDDRRFRRGPLTFEADDAFAAVRYFSFSPGE